ncbi:hypothetical protein [Methanosarcina thermophila]|jgi:hypothetical protein|nr:hypothetical protein [Methanosarcina thermophila]
MTKNKINLFKIPIKPFSIIFWAAVIVVMAVFRLLLGRKKADLRKK